MIVIVIKTNLAPWPTHHDYYGHHLCVFIATITTIATIVTTIIEIKMKAGFYQVDGRVRGVLLEGSRQQGEVDNRALEKQSSLYFLFIQVASPT